MQINFYTYIFLLYSGTDNRKTILCELSVIDIHLSNYLIVKNAKQYNAEVRRSSKYLFSNILDGNVKFIGMFASAKYADTLFRSYVQGERISPVCLAR